jgi:hypothetical protein
MIGQEPICFKFSYFYYVGWLSSRHGQNLLFKPSSYIYPENRNTFFICVFFVGLLGSVLDPVNLVFLREQFKTFWQLELYCINLIRKVSLKWRSTPCLRKVPFLKSIFQGTVWTFIGSNSVDFQGIEWWLRIFPSVLRY